MTICRVVKSARQERGERHHHAHDQLENRRQPLPGGHGDAEIGYDGRQRGGQLQLREVADERDERQDGKRSEGHARKMAVHVAFVAGERRGQRGYAFTAGCAAALCEGFLRVLAVRAGFRAAVVIVAAIGHCAVFSSVPPHAPVYASSLFRCVGIVVYASFLPTNIHYSYRWATRVEAWGEGWGRRAREENVGKATEGWDGRTQRGGRREAEVE